MAAIKDEKEDNKTGKMLALFDIMIHGHPLTKEQIATRFDVNARTANRYLAAIRQYLEEAEKEDGPRRELRYSREEKTGHTASPKSRTASFPRANSSPSARSSLAEEPTAGKTSSPS